MLAHRKITIAAADKSSRTVADAPAPERTMLKIKKQIPKRFAEVGKM
jgi:hypothetical protein